MNKENITTWQRNHEGIATQLTKGRNVLAIL